MQTFCFFLIPTQLNLFAQNGTRARDAFRIFFWSCSRSSPIVAHLILKDDHYSVLSVQFKRYEKSVCKPRYKYFTKLKELGLVIKWPHLALIFKCCLNLLLNFSKWKVFPRVAPLSEYEVKLGGFFLDHSLKVKISVIRTERASKTLDLCNIYIWSMQEVRAFWSWK